MPLKGACYRHHLRAFAAFLQLLERVSFLLRSPAAAAAASPLLLILQTYARAGADAARAVWQCPGILKALQGLLQSTLTLAVDAMAVLRLLASSSSQMMKAVASSGKKLHWSNPPPHPPSTDTPQPSCEQQQHSTSCEVVVGFCSSALR